MDIYLIRHTEAVELGQEGATTDFDRPLNDNGRAQAQKLATSLPARGSARIERLFISPLTPHAADRRAADLCLESCGKRCRRVPWISPGGRLLQSSPAASPSSRLPRSASSVTAPT